MAENFECPIDNTHETDLYGCIDCFFEALSNECLREAWKDEDLHIKSIKDLKARNSDNKQ